MSYLKTVAGSSWGNVLIATPSVAFFLLVLWGRPLDAIWEQVLGTIMVGSVLGLIAIQRIVIVEQAALLRMMWDIDKEV